MEVWALVRGAPRLPDALDPSSYCCCMAGLPDGWPLFEYTLVGAIAWPSVKIQIVQQ